jgi:hypothetical protein
VLEHDWVWLILPEQSYSDGMRTHREVDMHIRRAITIAALTVSLGGGCATGVIWNTAPAAHAATCPAGGKDQVFCHTAAGK